MKNPIYIEYYSHEHSDCYKINLPWPKYNKDIRVLCKVSAGYEYAKQLAQKEILKRFLEATQNPPKQEFVNEEREILLNKLEAQWDA